MWIKKSVGVKCLIYHRNWIERRRIFQPLWLLIRSESIRVIEIGLGTNDALWTAGHSY
jgi:hypothetical protein